MTADLTFERLRERVRSLLALSDEELPDAIKSNLWAFHAIAFAVDKHLKEHVQSLISLASQTDPPGQLLAERGRRVIERVIADRPYKRPGADVALAIAPIQAAVAIISTIVSILIGTGGLAQFLNKDKATTNVVSECLCNAPSTTTDSKPHKSAPVAPELPGSSLFGMHAMQTAVIGVLLIILFTEYGPKFNQPLPENAAPSEVIAVGTLWQYSFGWKVIWSAWLAFYLVTTVASIQAFADGRWFVAVGELLSYVNSLGFYWCFFCLDVGSVNTPDSPDRNRPFVFNFVLVAVIGATLFTFKTCSLIAAGYLKDAEPYFDFILAIYYSVGISFFVGRLDSHLLKVPRLLLSFLYAYAALQLCAPFFKGMTPEITRLVYILALALKVTLFVTVNQFSSPDALRNYITRVSENRGE